MKRKKISIVGSGNLGATAGHLIALKELGDVVLVDIVEGMPQGKALDMSEAMPVEGSDVEIIGSNGYEATKDSDIVVITAGIPRKPGMSRDDLLETNTKIVKTVAENVVKYCPNAFYILVSNPLDAMVFVASKVTKVAKNKIVGMAGILDSARFRSFIADEANVSVENVNAFVMGGHGDTMLPLVRYSNIAGIPISEMISSEKVEQIVERTRKGGGEIVGLLKTGSAYYAPATAVVEMVEAVLKDKKKILPCAAYLSGEYGVDELFIGVPVKLGANGVEEIIEVKLDDSEKELFDKTVSHVKELTEKTKGILGS
ncbi:MAG: malate dehydrogenase [Candidatus Woesearchaeota archaeon]|nr:malate dehydrogenase [Candidatus Woesearchaeota archaeon]